MGKGKVRSERLKNAFGGYAYQELVNGIVDEYRQLAGEGLDPGQIRERLMRSHPESLVDRALAMVSHSAA